jgi:predicted RNA-binding protein YlqC (UPF0109 family)
MTDGPAFEQQAFERDDEDLVDELDDDEDFDEEDDGEDAVDEDALGEDGDEEDSDDDEDDADDDEDDAEDDDLDDEEDGDEDGDLDEDGDVDEEEPDGPNSSEGSSRPSQHRNERAVAASPGNRAEGGAARAVLEHIARSIVDDPDSVVVEVSEARSGVKLSLHVAPGDMGRIIGRRGRVAQALRTVVRAAAASEGGDAVVDIVD